MPSCTSGVIWFWPGCSDQLHATASFALATVAAVALVVALGVVMERFVLRRLPQHEELPQALMTFGILLIVGDVSLWIWGGTPTQLPKPEGLSSSVRFAGMIFPSYRLFVIAVGIVVGLALWIFQERTRLGAMIRAAIDDAEIARATGINVSLLSTGVFALGAALAALGGIIDGPLVGVYPGADFEILRRRDHRRPRQPQGRAVRRLAGGPARHVRQGPVPRPRDVHDLRADGHHPRAAAHGTLRRAMTRGLALVAAVLLIALPWGLSSYQLGLLTKMLIFAVFAMSLNLILGYAGLPSLGHAAYFGVAAYTTALLSLRLTPNFWLDFAAGLLAASITAGLFGLLALRAQGSYLLMITLALAQVLWGIAFGWPSLTGGDDGLPGITRPAVGPWRLGDGISFYYFILVVFSLAVALMWLVVRSPFGRALVGIRESARRMEVLGYNVWLHKYVAFVLAGTLAGLSGALFVYYNGFVSPAYLSIVFSAMALIMVILGGAGTLLGPAVGSAAIVFLENAISAYTERWLLILGLIYVVVTLFARAGLLGLLRARQAAVRM